jgi:hypothetical protein
VTLGRVDRLVADKLLNKLGVEIRNCQQTLNSSFVPLEEPAYTATLVDDRHCGMGRGDGNINAGSTSRRYSSRDTLKAVIGPSGLK